MLLITGGVSVSLQSMLPESDCEGFITPEITGMPADYNWYAVCTLPQNEKSVLKHLEMRDIESFLPCYETVRIWKNRQRIKITLPLFPRYLFVRIERRERVKVLQSPGVLQIVGNGRESIPIPYKEIDLLRSGLRQKKMEPYEELVVGEKVRIKCGVMQGIKGLLVRKNNSLRFVLTLELIHQTAAIEVDAEDLEPIVGS